MSRMRVVPSQTARRSLGALAVVVTVLLAFPGPVGAQLPLPLPLPLPGDGSGGSSITSSSSTSATALQATVLGSTTTLASTGTLVDSGDVLAAGLPTGAIPSVGGAEVLNAAAGGEGDPVQAISSEASLGNLDLTVAGIGITADSVMARALAIVGGGSAGEASLDGLVVNGMPVVPSGAANETISAGPITLVLNEVQQTASGITVNALHITSLDGLVDVVVASATAATQ